MTARYRRNTAAKARRDRWRQRVVDGMTPELRAALSPAEVMYLWANGSNGDTYFYSGDTVRKLIDKGLLVEAPSMGAPKLTQKGAMWALRIMEVYGYDPADSIRAAGVSRTRRIAAGEPGDRYEAERQGVEWKPERS